METKTITANSLRKLELLHAIMLGDGWERTSDIKSHWFGLKFSVDYQRPEFEPHKEVTTEDRIYWRNGIIHVPKGSVITWRNKNRHVPEDIILIEYGIDRSEPKTI